ncbi:unnamed protein product [Heterobilharzia americana]|nr:unnamed protein product [Heterobilharzia americana]
MKYAYNQELAKIQLQFTIHLSDYYKNPLQLHSNSIPITENLTIDEKNNTNIHSSEYTTDINDDDDDCERNLNRQNSSHSNVNSILSKLFDNNHTEFINLKPPNKDERYSFFYSVLIDWPQLTYLQLLDIREKSVNSSDRHIPSPQPIVEEDLPPKSTYPVHYTPEELAVIESREMQLFRRLRQVLRRVVAHLASFRRFTVFTRPVQIDEAPDYYDVIKQPMDLGSIRDKIDCHQYHNVNDFMKDIELVYRNALEYNPANIPRSRDIRSRAYEFWDEACIRMEEELQPVDLNELCEEALSARAARLSNEKMVKTPSTMKKKETECRSTHRNDENLQKSSIKQPLPPLPQGDRYSRRLHGESPILELNDILQLQSCSSRRRSTFTPSTRKSVSVLQTNQHTPDLDISMSSFDVVLKPSESSTHDLDSKLTIEPLLESDVSSSSPKQLYLSKSSPIGKSPTPSQQQQQQSTPLQIDLQRLNHFLDRVVVKTDGWSTMQLVNLHTDFTNIILWKYAHITNRLSLSDLNKGATLSKEG